MKFEEARKGMPDDIEVKDISYEQWRDYLMSSGQLVHIDYPVALHVSASGGHYVVDIFGMAHYIPYKWDRLRWDNIPNVDRICFVSPSKGGVNDRNN